MNATLPANEEVVLAKPLSYATPAAALAPVAPQRLVSLDAFRGLAMVLMASAGLYMSRVAKFYPNSPTWHFLGWHTDHTEWTGCTLWDLIQPCFMFMVGAALPFSIASRQAKGQSFARMFFHAAWRAIVLVLLSVFLMSKGWKHSATNWTEALTLASPSRRMVIGRMFPSPMAANARLKRSVGGAKLS
jgi:predicted acyltransferase